MFTIKPKYEPKVTVLTSLIPRIEISTDALTNMKLYIDGCADEIGWLGTAYKERNVIYIDKVYLFEQQVHSTTTEITPEGLATFGEEILTEQDGMDIWNNLKMWGHSHVNMGVTPSGQDDKQMETFATNGHDWFVRLIGNKKGDLRLDVYDYATGVVYQDLAWNERLSADELAVHEYIEQLYQSLQDNREAFMNMLAPSVKEEIALKVSKIVYNRAVTVVPPKNNVLPLEIGDNVKKNSPGKSDVNSGSEGTSLEEENFEVWYDSIFNQVDTEDMQAMIAVDEIQDYIYQFHGIVVDWNTALKIRTHVNTKGQAHWWNQNHQFEY